jgi:hypothetical protein
MGIVVTPAFQRFRQDQEGNYVRRAKLVVSGLSSATPSTIAHELPGVPIRWHYVPRVAAGGFETQDPDATNFYWTTATNQTDLIIFVDY